MSVVKVHSVTYIQTLYTQSLTKLPHLKGELPSVERVVREGGEV